MFEKASTEFADQILRSYYFNSGPRRINQNGIEMPNSRNGPPLEIFFPIFVDLDLIRVAALMLRKLKPRVFGSTSIKLTEEFIRETINSEISTFFEASLAHGNKTTDYLSAITEMQRARFHDFIQHVLSSKIPTKTFSFPIKRISVNSKYDGKNYFILDGTDIGSDEKTIS